MTFIKNNAVALVAVIIALCALLGFGHTAVTSLFGSVSCSDTTCLTGGLRILTGVFESDGTFTLASTTPTQTSMSIQSCNLVGMNGSQPATSTKAYDCAVTGVIPTDNVFAFLSTSTPVITAATNAGLGWTITAADASSTAGFVTVLVYYGSGGAAVPSVTSVGSSTQILFGH